MVEAWNVTVRIWHDSTTWLVSQNAVPLVTIVCALAIIGGVIAYRKRALALAAERRRRERQRPVRSNRSRL